MSKSPERTTAPPIKDRIDRQMQPHITAQSCTQRAREALLLGFVQGDRGDDFDVRHVLGLGLQLFEVLGDLGQVIDTAVLREQVEQCPAVRVERAAANPGDQLDELARANARAALRATGIRRSARWHARSRATPTMSRAWRSPARRRRPPSRKVSQSWLSRPCVVYSRVLAVPRLITPWRLRLRVPAARSGRREPADRSHAATGGKRRRRPAGRRPCATRHGHAPAPT